MSDKVNINLGGKTVELDVIIGTENEPAIDIANLRAATGFVTLDFGYKNTGATTSKITFLDGELGILRYRGYDIADLADKASFEEVMYLLIHGELPNQTQLDSLKSKLREYADVPQEIANVIKAMPKDTHPMAQLSSACVLLSAYFPKATQANDDDIVKLLAKFSTLVAMVIRNAQGADFVAPDANLDYVANFMNMAFGKPASSVVLDAMDKLLILHADHEQNCSTSSVRIVGSSGVNMYAAIAGGINALWGPAHGGANQKVLEQLEAIQADGGDTEKFVNMAKDKESGFRLMGFGHRVYKNFDPRAKIIKVACDNVLEDLGIKSEKLRIAKELEAAALSDDYFKSRNLYPNVDFYSGIIYNAIGFETNVFTTLFALGRLPGWVSQWKEMKDNKEPIGRPRQIYMGDTLRSYLPIEER
ncbi:MAG: citrate synthase [Chitinophagales bacterium]|nr:citrate synthase [Chitinophagales bacterium]